ncbi:MAG: PqqD family protein [Candidatus Aenigmatarchaeota archaeon]
MFEGKRPKKAESLTIINYLNTYYATLDNQKLYQIDPLAVGLLKYCDGKRKYEEILEILAQKTQIDKEMIKKFLDELFRELTELNFIYWE